MHACMHPSRPWRASQHIGQSVVLSSILLLVVLFGLFLECTGGSEVGKAHRASSTRTNPHSIHWSIYPSVHLSSHSSVSIGPPSRLSTCVNLSSFLGHYFCLSMHPALYPSVTLPWYRIALLSLSIGFCCIQTLQLPSWHLCLLQVEIDNSGHNGIASVGVSSDMESFSCKGQIVETCKSPRSKVPCH